jgi:hypothetical protein
MPSGIPKNGINKGWFKKGHKVSVDFRKKLSERNKKFGIKPPLRNGIPSSQLQKDITSKIHKGKKDTIETKLKRIASAKRGKDCHFWKGGITSLKILIRQSYKYRQWRSDVFTRDNFTCQLCGIRGGKLNSDHIKSFSLILEQNNVKTIIDAFECEELWNINNGRTLCEKCHVKTDNFGNKSIINYFKEKKHGK